MTIIDRPYRPTDQPHMIALARHRPDDNMHVVDLPYRLSSWALDDPNNIRLWEDADTGELLMWAMLQSPMWTVDIVCGPLNDVLYPAALAWAETRALQILATRFGHPMWFVNVFSGHADRSAALRDAGYEDQGDVGADSWSKVLLRRPVSTKLDEAPPPPGFTIRPLAGASEVQAYVDLHRAAFESRNMTLEWRQRTLAHPDYRPNLDLVAVAPDGKLAAFCICWFDLILGAGQVEPLGVGADYRRGGLGRAILYEGIRRLTAAGAMQVYIESDAQNDAAYTLYRSAGFQPAHDVRVYRKVFA